MIQGQNNNEYHCNIGVSAGNEEVLSYYEKYGFRERVSVLQKDMKDEGV